MRCLKPNHIQNFVYIYQFNNFIRFVKTISSIGGKYASAHLIKRSSLSRRHRTNYVGGPPAQRDEDTI